MKESFISFFLLLFLSVAAWGEDVTATVTYPNYPGDRPEDATPCSYSGEITIPATITVDDVTYRLIP